MTLHSEMAPALAEQYADMLSLDFRTRQAQLTSLNHNLDDLMAWDLRMQAYLNGLCLLEKEAEKYFESQLLSPLSRGDVFALGTFAFTHGNATLLEGCCRLTQALPSLLPVLGSVMEWAPTASPLWKHIDDYPTLRLLASWHRPDIELHKAVSQFDLALMTNQPAVVPALALALSQRVPQEYSAAIHQWVQSDDVRIICAMLTAILTRKLSTSGLPVEALLHQVMLAKSEETQLQAARLALLCTSIPHSETLTFIRTQTNNPRLYIQALGIAGAAAHISVLREYLEVPEYARLAAASVSLLTGSRPEADGWAGTAPLFIPGEQSYDEHIPASDPDDMLAWPDVPAFDLWWHRHARDFDLRHSYLGGQPVTPSGMLHVLQSGAMAMRPLAAMRWQHITGRTLFLSSAPATVQQQQLQRLMTQDNPV